MGIHHNRGKTIIINYPGRNETADGRGEEYIEIANSVRERCNVAFVRASNPSSESCDYRSMVKQNLRQIIEYVTSNSDDICGAAMPDIYLTGVSAGASAIAAIACEYPQVKKILLVRFSDEAGGEDVLSGLSLFAGESYTAPWLNDEEVIRAFCGDKGTRL